MNSVNEGRGIRGIAIFFDDNVAGDS